jgi:hypothetical protein
MFAPNGSVLNYPGADKLTFWIRETAYPNYKDAVPSAPVVVFRGDPSLVVVYPTSGLVNGYDVDLHNPANPYTNVK